MARRTLGEPDSEPTLEGVTSAFGEVIPLLIANKYSEVGTLLPTLLRDSDTLVTLSVNGGEVAARGLRAKIRQVCASLMSHTWQFDVADHAAQLAADDATDPAHPHVGDR